MKQHLDEFIFDQLKLIEDFENAWLELHRKNPEIYPLELTPGEWMEQMAFYDERENNETSQ